MANEVVAADVVKIAAVVDVASTGVVVVAVKAVVVDWPSGDAVLLWRNGKSGWSRSCPSMPSSCLLVLLSLSLLIIGLPF